MRTTLQWRAVFMDQLVNMDDHAQVAYALSITRSLNTECFSIIQKLFTKSIKWAVTSKSYQATDIFADRDEKVFSAMCTWTNHCLHHLLPSE